MLNIMLTGVGGQGTVLAAKVLAQAALEKGWHVRTAETIGMAQRGGSVVTFIRFDKKVYEPIVEAGQVDVLISFERLEALRYAHFLKKDGVLIVNDSRIDPMTVVIGSQTYPENIIEKLSLLHKVYSIDGLNIAKELGNPKVLNSAVLGASAKHIGFSKEQWLESLSATVPAKTVEINKRAFLEGYGE